MRYSLIIAALVISSGPAWADGDAVAGKTAFNKCAICHSIKDGENKIGPSLYGVIGRKSHSEAGYTYSESMKKYDVTWDADALNTYLVDPRKVVVGTKMIFPGIKDETERSNVIAYLATLK